MRYFVLPILFRKLFPNVIFNFPNNKGEIFLTFDDGPEAEVTPWVLSILKQYNAKATFFCIGEKVKKNPDLFFSICSQGHKTGNHSFKHLNGWKTKNWDYFKDIEYANRLINSDLFRPPYGKIKPCQIKILRKKYKIIAWDVLSNDFNINVKKELCLDKIIKYTKSGSIVVFHDTIKAFDSLKYILPKFLNVFSQKGFVFKSL